jgi:hypothetical protein
VRVEEVVGLATIDAAQGKVRPPGKVCRERQRGDLCLQRLRRQVHELVASRGRYIETRLTESDTPTGDMVYQPRLPIGSTLQATHVSPEDLRWFVDGYFGQ